MIDIQFVRENPDVVKEKSAQKNVKVDVDRLLKLDGERRELLQSVEVLRQERNKIAEAMKDFSGKPDEALVEKGRALKVEIAEKEGYLGPVTEELATLLKQIPNMPTDDVPVGATEEENVVVKTVGEPTAFDFEPKSQEELGAALDLFDKERAAKISGARYAYIKGDLVRLQFALMSWVTDLLTDEAFVAKIIKDNKLDLKPTPFVPILPPVMMRTDAYEATGRLKAEEVTYRLADDDLWLIGSAEHSLCAMYRDEVIPAEQLPIRYLGYSTSFRREAGTYGKDMGGLTRLHHFDKLEMEVFSDAETSRAEHDLLIAIQEYMVAALELPYRVLNKCTADIGDPNARGVDIEVWVPSQGQYRETHSADYMTDFQARGLNTRYRNKTGELQFAHTNDATAFALGRLLGFLIENYQTAEGTIGTPKVLQPYLGIYKTAA